MTVRQGDVFTLVLMSSPPRVVVGKPALEHAEILREIEALQPAQTPVDLPGVLAAIEQLLPKTQRENPRITQHEVYFLTDLQSVSWLPKLGKTALAEFSRRSAALADAAQIVILDVGQPDAENLAVTAFSPSDPIVIAGRDVNFTTSIKNFGRQTRTRQLVELLVDGRRIEQKFVDVPAGEEISLNFMHRFETPGDHALEIRAAGDALEEDNHRFLAVNVRQEIRVLCIDGRPSGQAFRGATDYLAEALSPQGNDSRQIAIKPEVAAESALVERELARYDCVFICNVAQFTPHEVRLLHNYLQSGGNVVFFLGDQVLPERYNRELTGETTSGQEGRAGEGRILPARLAALIDQPQLRLDPLRVSASDSAGLSRPGRKRVAHHAGFQVFQAAGAEKFSRPRGFGDGKRRSVGCGREDRARACDLTGHLGRYILDGHALMAQLPAAGSRDFGVLPGGQCQTTQSGSGPADHRAGAIRCGRRARNHANARRTLSARPAANPRRDEPARIRRHYPKRHVRGPLRPADR